MEGSSRLLVAIPALIGLIFTYRYFLHDDRYKQFIKREKYQRDIYRGWKGNMIVALYLLIPVVMLTLYFLFMLF